MFITKKKHDAIVAGWADDLRATHNRLVSERDAETKRANELERHITMADNQTRAACTDRDRYRDLHAASEQRRNEIGAELDHWRKHGQLRDPATGRLIPKEAAAAKRKAKGEGV